MLRLKVAVTTVDLTPFEQKGYKEAGDYYMIMSQWIYKVGWGAYVADLLSTF